MRVVRVLPKGGNDQVVRVPSFFYHEERLDAELICTTLSYSNSDSKCLKTDALCCCYLLLDNKPVRFGFRRCDTKVVFYELQAVRLDIFWVKMLGTQSIHTKRH